MASERVVAGTGALVFGLLSIVLWGDYLSHSHEVYDERSQAQAQIKDLNDQILNAGDTDQLQQLNDDLSGAQLLYQDAERRINDMDGWNSPEWKVKNSLRLASPALAVLFLAFTLLAVLHPLKE